MVAMNVQSTSMLFAVAIAGISFWAEPVHAAADGVEEPYSLEFLGTVQRACKITGFVDKAALPLGSKVGDYVFLKCNSTEKVKIVPFSNNSKFYVQVDNGATKTLQLVNMIP